MMLLFSFFMSYWFIKEIIAFPEKINKQVFDNYQEIIKSNLTFNQFNKRSCLKYKGEKFIYLLYIFIPCVYIANLFIKTQISFNEICTIIILQILIFLSFLDITYRLTDIKYIIIVFILSLIKLLMLDLNLLYENMLNIILVISFFYLFYLLSHYFISKEIFGAGDMIVLVAISPLFHFNQMIMLLFISSLFSILFVVIWYFFYKEKLNKIAFIPFITLSASIFIALQ